MTQPDFTLRRNIRFADTDPAGIVFYPRYFEMFVEVVEDFFAEMLGVPFARLHLELGLAIPLVRAEVDFLLPSRIGDRLDFGLSVLGFGRTSFTAGIEATAPELRLRARLVMVFMSIAEARPVAPPAQIAARLAAFGSKRQAADAGAAADE